MAEERQRCSECNRLYPKGAKPVAQRLSPICKLCKKPLVESSPDWWVCPDKNMAHRGLIHRSAVAKAGFGKKPHETFEV